VVCKIGNTTVMTRDHRFTDYDRLLAETWGSPAQPSRWQRFVKALRKITGGESVKPIDSEGGALPDSVSVYIYAPDEEGFPKHMAPEIWINVEDAIHDGVEGIGLWSIPLRDALREFVMDVRKGNMGSVGIAAMLREFADQIDGAAREYEATTERGQP
jgi:hypothetical protein